MKRFVFQIIIEEGNDEFWEEVNANPGKGVEDLHIMLRECLSHAGMDDSDIRLVEYTDK